MLWVLSYGCLLILILSCGFMVVSNLLLMMFFFDELGNNLVLVCCMVLMVVIKLLRIFKVEGSVLLYNLYMVFDWKMSGL